MIWIPALVLAAVGGGVAAMLVIASKVFHVEGAELVEEVNEQLPGVNCGACGFPGCMGYAEAVANEGVAADKCVPGGPDIVPKIHAVLGESESASAEVQAGTAEVVSGHEWPVRSEPVIPRVAFVACGGGNDVEYRYDYVGIATCAAVNQVGGGFKQCYAACQGLGDCVRACLFDAMVMIDGLAVVDPDACTGCSLCVDACPKGLISMVPVDAQVLVRCSNRLKGKAVSSVCAVGCIACKKCEKDCPSEAIVVRDCLAEVDHEKCTGKLVCVEACPTDCLFAGSMAAFKDSLGKLAAGGGGGLAESGGRTGSGGAEAEGGSEADAKSGSEAASKAGSEVEAGVEAGLG